MSIYDENWDIIGHHWAVKLLGARLESGRIGHAYLFTGPPGVGKTTLATRFAQALNCTGFNAPCGKCRACDLIARGLHADIHTLVDSEGRSIKIEDIRELQSSLVLRPLEARYRIAIIPEIHEATPHAADALLKTLEEPATTTRLMLTATAAEKTVSTIVSRCQIIPLRPVPADQIAAALAQKYDVPSREAQMLARLSGGRPGWALSAVKQPETLAERAEIIDGLLGALHENRTGRFEYCNTIMRDDALSLILDMWQSWWRDVLLVAERSSVPPVNADRMEDIEDLAYRITPQDARRALRAVRRTINALDKNANTRLALEVMLLDMPFV